MAKTESERDDERRRRKSKEKKEKKAKHRKEKHRKKSKSKHNSSSDSSDSTSSSSSSDENTFKIPDADLLNARTTVIQMIERYPANVDDLKGILVKLFSWRSHNQVRRSLDYGMFKLIDKGELVMVRDIQDISIKSAIIKLFGMLRILPQGCGYKHTSLTPNLYRCFRDCYHTDEEDDKRAAKKAKAKKSKSKKHSRKSHGKSDSKHSESESGSDSDAEHLSKDTQETVSSHHSGSSVVNIVEVEPQFIGPAGAPDTAECLRLLAHQEQSTVDITAPVTAHVSIGPMRPSEALLMAAAAAEFEIVPDADQSDRQDVNVNDDNEEDDDNFGPSAPKPGQELIYVPLPFNAIRTEKGKIVRGLSDPNAREDWMTELPPDFAISTDVAMVNRAFSSTEKGSRGDVSGWTDTPLDRQKKAEAARARQIHTLAVEAATGKKRKNTSDADAAVSASKLQSKYAPRMDPVIEDVFLRAARPKTLLELHHERLLSESKAAKKASQMPTHHGRFNTDLSAPPPIDPRLARFDPKLLTPSFDRDRDFSMPTSAALNRGQILADKDELRMRFSNAGQISQFM